MKLQKFVPLLFAAVGLFAACTDANEKPERNDDSETGSGGTEGSGGSKGSGGSASNLHDPLDGVEVCTSMKSEGSCMAVEFDFSNCVDCSGRCAWGTVQELHDQSNNENVIGKDGIIAPIGGQGGFGGSLSAPPACYLLAGDGG